MNTKDEQRVIRLYYERTGPLAWIAHLDMMRLFERALARAGWPVSWTEEAFNPRPQLVFALPVGVGIETRMDPVDIILEDPDKEFQVEDGLLRLRAALPAGVRIRAFEETDPRAKSLMARVTGASYRIEAPGILEAYEKTFRGGPVEVSRIRKKKKSTVDLTPRIFKAEGEGEDILVVTGGAGSQDHLRTDLLLEALVSYGGLAEDAAQGARIVRLSVFLDAKPAGEGIIVEMADA